MEGATGNVDLSTSLGLVISTNGRVGEVLWDSPAFKAGLIPGGTITSVNNSPFAIEKLVSTVLEAESGAQRQLGVKGDTSSAQFTILWTGGMRYPHLERVPGPRAPFDDILLAK